MNDLIKAKLAGTLIIPAGRSILMPYGKGRMLDSETYDFGIVNSPVDQGSKKRHSDKIQIRFQADSIKKIDLNGYLPQFVYFETITIHLLALIDATSLDEYYEKQKDYREVDLIDRVQELRRYAKQNNISNIGKLANLLEVRNEIAHNLYPIAITYNSKIYPYDDVDFIARIKTDSVKAMQSLVDLYECYMHKIEVWLTPILERTPAQVIMMADGSIKTNEKRY